MTPNIPEGLEISKLSPRQSIDDLPFRDFYIVSFHTSGKLGRHYEEEVPEFLQAAGDLGYGERCIILDAGDKPNWRACTMLKAVVCEWALEHLPSHVVWIDIDARIRDTLHRFHDWDGRDIGMRFRKDDTMTPHWLSGTLFLNQDNRVCHEMVQEWRKGAVLAADHKGPYAHIEGDQDILGKIIDRRLGQKSASVHDLPPEYAFVFDIDRKRHPGKVPIIEHMQASRRRRYQK